MRTRRDIEELDVPQGPLWFKVTGMLNQNWATVVETLAAGAYLGAARIYFFDDHGAVFDTLEFPSAAQADQALAFNGFTPLNEEPGFEAIAGLPRWPLTQSLFNKRPVYSSGEYWQRPSSLELVTQRRVLTARGLNRFIEAQAPVFEEVLKELGAGHKETHWMWFVFPQINGLGSSAMSRKYGIANLDEARSFLRHQLLGHRLHQCFSLVLEHQSLNAVDIFGYIDAKKFLSCATLFDRASDEEASIFSHAIRVFFDGKSDPQTLELL